MKNKFALTSYAAVIILLMVALFVTNCKKPTDGVKLILNTNLIRTAIGLSIIDANTGEPVGYSDGTTVNISIEGPDKGAIIDAMGTSEFKTQKGFSNLAIDPDFTPTSAKPIKFVIVASASGYLTTSLPVTIAKDGGYNYTISMIKISAPPAGVSAKSTTITTNGFGATTAPIIILSGIVSATNTEATITIPTGTILMDENNTPLTGNLTTKLVYFSDGTDASINSFPGGLSATTDQGDKFFSTAGFVSLEISNASGSVKKFSQPIQINIGINPNTNLPDGLTKVKVGDSIPVWSYEVSTGSWSSELQSTVQDGGSGKLVITLDVNHLSYWNLDWFYGGNCGTGATINVTGNLPSSGNYNSNYYYYELRREADGSILKSGMQDFTNGSSFTLLNAPNVLADLKVYEGGTWYSCNSNLKKIAELLSVNLCSGNYTIDVNGTVPQAVSLKVSAKCDDRPDFVIRPTIPIYVKEKGACGWWQYAGLMVNGQISSTVVKVGKTYIFGIYFDGKWYEPEYTVDKFNYDFDYTFTAQTCKKFK